MLADWLERPGARARLEQWSAASGLDLVTLGTTASKDEIRDTAVTQPLVVAAALLAAAELRDRGLLPEAEVSPADDRHRDTVVAGHSIGELAALAMAGVISDDDAVLLAAIRGSAMAKACADHDTSMVAVLGGRENEVRTAIADAGLYPANINASGQIVAAGDAAACAALSENPPTRAKVRQLEVAGAFHTPFMQSAVEEFATVAAAVTVSDPECTLLSNVDGQAVSSGHEALDRVVSQVTSPVRWDLCSQTQTELGVSAFIELPPSGALAGIAKRQMRGVDRLAMQGPDDLDSANSLAMSASASLYHCA